MQHEKQFDVIIIGGSYAGLSAAMSLGRSLRQVLVMDSGSPCNIQTPHSHNFITQDGENPAAIAQRARAQVVAYETVHFVDQRAATAAKTGTGFRVTSETGENFAAKKLILATGIKDTMPDIKGFTECWGISVVHCPYCHGYEFKGKKTGILANGERGFHVASLVNNLTDDLSMIVAGDGGFTAEQFKKFEQHQIAHIEKEVAEIVHTKGYVEKLVFTDGSEAPFDVLYAAVPFKQHSEIPEMLGCALTEMGHIETDAFQKTSIEGVFACGDNSTMMRAVAAAVASGNLAGAMVNKVLTDETF